ncbi:MAG: hypothetical protein AABZ00_04865 [Chloroflexota bacterium]
MKVHRPILMLIALVLFVSLACTTLLGTPETETSTETNPFQVEALPTQTKQATEAVPTETPLPPNPYFTEEFDTDPQWDLVIVPDNANNSQTQSDPKSVTTTFSDSRMIFHIPEDWLSAFYTYTEETYKDVRLDIEFDNQGVNSQQVSLVCRSDGDDKSYELEVGNDGKWVFKVNRRPVSNGASIAIKTGKGINQYTMFCIGNEISFLFNGVEPKGSPYVDRQAGLGAGNVGFVVTAKRAIPVDVQIDWFQVSEP